MTLLLNALAASSVKLLANWGGPWVADVEYDLGAAGIEASGRVVTTIDREILLGTVDPDSSGALGPKGRARIIGGGGGWQKVVAEKDYVNPAGVLSTAVLATTAAEVGEVVVDAVPGDHGPKYVRAKGPASSVLAGREWYVDATGTTIAGPRLPIPALPTVQVLDWDPSEKLATIAADGIVWPGTILTDTRFGIVRVRDVEQTWNDGGARARAWCMPIDGAPIDGGSRLIAGLRALARHATAAPHLVGYAYRVGLQNPVTGKLALQAVRPAKGIPNQAEVEIAFGVPGIAAKLTPGSIVYVNFLEGDPSKPYVSAFETSGALELTITTISLVVGLGRAPVMLMTPTMATWISAVTVALNTLAPGSAIAPIDAASLVTRSD